MGVFIDTWTPEGYVVSMELDIKESKLANDVMPKRHITPLMNTVYYIGQTYPDIFARRAVTTDFTLPRDARNVELKYIVTGHGAIAAATSSCRNRTLFPWMVRKH